MTLQTVGEFLVQNPGVGDSVTGGTLGDHLVLYLVTEGTAEILVFGRCSGQQGVFLGMACRTEC